MFENEEFSDQKLKCLFLINLLAWLGIYIKEGSMSLIEFVDEKVVFCFS